MPMISGGAEWDWMGLDRWEEAYKTQRLWVTIFLSARSIHNGVIAVFQRKGLPDQELFILNEGVR